MKKFFETHGKIPKACIFLSGSGTNAEKLLESLNSGMVSSWIPALLFTDAPEKSRAYELAKKFNIPCEALDIKKFYIKHGESKVSILSQKGQNIREEWTNRLRKILKPFNPDFGIFAGFVPLSNIIKDFPCLNVHPGDLTLEENGKRILTGLHVIPIETAIIKGLSTLRSSVIVAQPYTGSGGEMDTGPVLGISEPVQIDLMGYSIDQIKESKNKRPPIKPVGGYNDILEKIASHNQSILKQNGDWIVLPKTADDFAKGCFARDQEGKLCFFDNNIQKWIKIKTVVYGKNYSQIEI